MTQGKSITIFDNENLPVITFPAPADKYVARSLWVFLVDNLQPGFIVELGDEVSEITRVSGMKVPIELYSSLMSGGEEGPGHGHDSAVHEDEQR